MKWSMEETTQHYHQYLKELSIHHSDTVATLTAILDKLVNFLLASKNEGHLSNCTTVQCKNLLYASASVRAVVEILTTRGYSTNQIIDLTTTPYKNDTKTIILHAVQWCATELLIAENGERFTECIFHFYDTLNMTKDDGKNLLEHVMQTLARNAMLKTIVYQCPALQTKAESLLLLTRLQKLSTTKKIACAIDNIVWFRSTDLTIVHLMHILLLEPGRCGYKMSCYVYRHFIVAMRQQRREFLHIFWTKLKAVFEMVEAVALFHRCTRLTEFYDCLSGQMTKYLSLLRRYTKAEDYHYASDEPFSDVQFRDVSRIACLLLATKSPVRLKFSQLIHSVVTDSALKVDLFQFLIYD